MVKTFSISPGFLAVRMWEIQREKSHKKSRKEPQSLPKLIVVRDLRRREHLRIAHAERDEVELALQPRESVRNGHAFARDLITFDM
eukprot:SAG31_NODE_6247_length_2103_cov_1.347305_4_plen_86_part_00